MRVIAFYLQRTETGGWREKQDVVIPLSSFSSFCLR